jgi:hypothetical protein
MSKTKAAAPPARVPKIDLSPLAADAPDPSAPSAVTAALMDPETKKVFEQLIVEIRRQLAAGGGSEPGAGVPASVVTDLNNLRDSIALMAASLDADTGVATTTYAATCTPPPITTA